MPAERDLTAAIDEAGIRGRFVLVFGLIALLLVCELFDYFVVGYLVSAIAPTEPEAAIVFELNDGRRLCISASTPPALAVAALRAVR